MPNTIRSGGLTLVTAALLVGLATQADTQSLPSDLPTKEDLAKDNNLFLTLARRALKWDEPTVPVHIIGPLYFVGTRD